MKEVTVKNLYGYNVERDEWDAEYNVFRCVDAYVMEIDSRYIYTQAVVFKNAPPFHITVPSHEIEITNINTLTDISLIADKLIERGMAEGEALVIATVLADYGEFDLMAEGDAGYDQKTA